MTRVFGFSQETELCTVLRLCCGSEVLSLKFFSDGGVLWQVL